jgi:hypothetical protein
VLGVNQETGFLQINSQEGSMSNEPNSNSAHGFEEDDTITQELFRQQTDQWLEMCLDDMFSNLTEDDLTQTDEYEEPLSK